MTRIEVNVETGETRIVALTPEEEAAALARTALEAAANTPDAKAARFVDAVDRLWFEVNFDQENRVRAQESKAQITRIQYRDALIARWKTLNA